MVKSFIQRWYSRTMRKQKEPWAVLEVQSFEKDGRLKIGFDYNQAFVDKVKELGYQAETDEDTVQLFFVASALRPTGLVGDEAVQPDAHPQLSSPQNVIVQ